MEEIEVPLEDAHEKMHEAAHHSQEKWISGAALASAIIAVVAAIAALFAGGTANEAMIEQMKASNAWNYFQAKSVKSAVLSSKMELMEEMGKTLRAKDEEKISEYKSELVQISKEAKELSDSSEHYLKKHEVISKAVTLLQIAIAMGAISVLSRRRKFWFVSLGFAFIGTGFLLAGFLT